MGMNQVYAYIYEYCVKHSLTRVIEELHKIDTSPAFLSKVSEPFLVTASIQSIIDKNAFCDEPLKLLLDSVELLRQHFGAIIEDEFSPKKFQNLIHYIKTLLVVNVIIDDEIKVYEKVNELNKYFPSDDETPDPPDLSPLDRYRCQYKHTQFRCYCLYFLASNKDSDDFMTSEQYRRMKEKVVHPALLLLDAVRRHLPETFIFKVCKTAPESRQDLVYPNPVIREVVLEMFCSLTRRPTEEDLLFILRQMSKYILFDPVDILSSQESLEEMYGQNSPDSICGTPQRRQTRAAQNSPLDPRPRPNYHGRVYSIKRTNKESMVTANSNCLLSRKGPKMVGSPQKRLSPPIVPDWWKDDDYLSQVRYRRSNGLPKHSVGAKVVLNYSHVRPGERVKVSAEPFASSVHSDVPNTSATESGPSPKNRASGPKSSTRKTLVYSRTRKIKSVQRADKSRCVETQRRVRSKTGLDGSFWALNSRKRRIKRNSLYFKTTPNKNTGRNSLRDAATPRRKRISLEELHKRSSLRAGAVKGMVKSADKETCDAVKSGCDAVQTTCTRGVNSTNEGAEKRLDDDHVTKSDELNFDGNDGNVRMVKRSLSSLKEGAVNRMVKSADEETCDAVASGCDADQTTCTRGVNSISEGAEKRLDDDHVTKSDNELNFDSSGGNVQMMERSSSSLKAGTVERMLKSADKETCDAVKSGCDADQTTCKDINSASEGAEKQLDDDHTTKSDNELDFESNDGNVDMVERSPSSLKVGTGTVKRMVKSADKETCDAVKSGCDADQTTCSRAVNGTSEGDEKIPDDDHVTKSDNELNFDGNDGSVQMVTRSLSDPSLGSTETVLLKRTASLESLDSTSKGAEKRLDDGPLTKTDNILNSNDGNVQMMKRSSSDPLLGPTETMLLKRTASLESCSAADAQSQQETNERKISTYRQRQKRTLSDSFDPTDILQDENEKKKRRISFEQLLATEDTTSQVGNALNEPNSLVSSNLSSCDMNESTEENLDWVPGVKSPEHEMIKACDRGTCVIDLLSYKEQDLDLSANDEVRTIVSDASSETAVQQKTENFTIQTSPREQAPVDHVDSDSEKTPVGSVDRGATGEDCDSTVLKHIADECRPVIPTKNISRSRTTRGVRSWKSDPVVCSNSHSTRQQKLSPQGKAAFVIRIRYRNLRGANASSLSYSKSVKTNLRRKSDRIPNLKISQRKPQNPDRPTPKQDESPNCNSGKNSMVKPPNTTSKDELRLRSRTCKKERQNQVLLSSPLQKSTYQYGEREITVRRGIQRPPFNVLLNFLHNRRKKVQLCDRDLDWKKSCDSSGPEGLRGGRSQDHTQGAVSEFAAIPKVETQMSVAETVPPVSPEDCNENQIPDNAGSHSDSESTCSDFTKLDADRVRNSANQDHTQHTGVLNFSKPRTRNHSAHKRTRRLRSTTETRQLSNGYVEMGDWLIEPRFRKYHSSPRDRYSNGNRLSCGRNYGQANSRTGASLPLRNMGRFVKSETS